MNKTLKISFSLKNTYRVNGVLFSLKQIPLVKRLLPATLYQVKGLKIFANILSVLWEIVSVFLGKFLYFITMVCGIGILYNGLPENEVFLHILLILTVIGSFVNTHLFNPTKDKYYAMILMKMDAREYTLVNYFYSILALYDSVRYGQRRTFVVLSAPAPLHSGYEAVCGGCYPVGL